VAISANKPAKIPFVTLIPPLGFVVRITQPRRDGDIEQICRTKGASAPARNILTVEQKRARSEPDRLEVATDQAIAACGGDVGSAIKALIVANEYFELK
jgi:hypothetical protein